MALSTGATHASLAVAVSGGLDSTALLHCVVRTCSNLGVSVHALHVQHGLHADAPVWAEHVAAQCGRWGRRYGGLQFHQVRLTARPGRGESVEAWARRERYRALTQMCKAVGCELLLLAHHRRDQAETVLLQALRGAGPAGLSAMPRQTLRDGITWVRPWLHVPRSWIESYAARHRLSHVEDPSNASVRFARNRVRQDVLPMLDAVLGSAEATLCSVAHRAQEAQAVLDEVGRADVDAIIDGGALAVERWQTLSVARRRNALRLWARTRMGQGPPESLLDRLIGELPTVRSGRWPAPGGQMLVYRGRLTWMPCPTPLQAEETILDMRQPGDYELPMSRGVLRVEPARGAGVPRECLGAVVVRPRSGGERFQSKVAGIPRALKKEFQAAGVPAWQREQSVLWAGGRVLFVPGLGVDARALVDQAPDLLTLRWLA